MILQDIFEPSAEVDGVAYDLLISGRKKRTDNHGTKGAPSYSKYHPGKGKGKAAPEKKPTYDTSIAQLTVPKDLATEIREAKKTIAPEDRVRKAGGRWPHVTVVSGIKGESTDSVKDLISKKKAPTLTIEKATVFSNNPDYDVVILEVKRDQPLMKLRNSLKNSLTVEEMFAYRPHITVGFVKKGKGQEYADKFNKQFAGKTFKPKQLQFSDPYGDKVKATLNTERIFFFQDTQPTCNHGTKGAPSYYKYHGRSGGKGEVLEKATKVGNVWKMGDGSDLPAHIKVAIPPAWKEVYINPDPKGTLYVRGVDAKGRVQQRYSESHSAKAAAAKYGRVTELRKKRRGILRELRRDAENPRLADNADCLRVVMQTGLRPGGGKGKADYASYGATTLEGRHVVANKDGSVTLRLAIGKSKGQVKEFRVRDRNTAKMLLARASKAGPDGRLFQTNAAKLRKYSKSKDGKGFKTKDFRTAIGTETAIKAVKKIGNKRVFKSMRAYQIAAKKVATRVSEVLGNTPTVSLKSYIDPSVFSGWSVEA